MTIKTKALFPKSFYPDYHSSGTIVLYKNKVVSYKGIHPIFKKKDIKQVVEKVHINYPFTYERLDKYDRENYSVNATHRLKCKALHDVLLEDCYVRLNWFQSFYIAYYNNRLLINDFNFKKDVWLILIGAIIGAIITLLLNK